MSSHSVLRVWVGESEGEVGEWVGEGEDASRKSPTHTWNIVLHFFISTNKMYKKLTDIISQF
jgi:hypothetical protein